MFPISGEVIVFLYATIFTTNFLALPQLILHKVCLQNHPTNGTSCNDSSSHQIQKEASAWWFYLLTSNHVPALFFILVWGPITDFIGKRASTIIVVVFNSCQTAIYLLNAIFLEAHPGYLLFGSFLSSFYGEFQGVILLSYACIADSTSINVESRTTRMVIIEGFLILSGLLAGVATGLIIHHYGYVMVFGFVLCIDGLLLIFALSFLPVKQPSLNVEAQILLNDTENREESNATTNDNVEDIETNSIFSLKTPWYYLRESFIVITDSKYRHFAVPLLVALGLSLSALLGEIAVQVLFLKNKPFEFSAQRIGYYSAYQSAIRGVGALVITQISYRFCKLSDYTLMYIGLISQAISYILIGFSRSSLAIFLSNIPGCFMLVTFSAIRSLITKQVSDRNHGTVLASIEAVDVMFDYFTGAFTLWIYNVTTEIYTGIAFFFLSGFALLSMISVIVSQLCQRCSTEMD